MKIVTMLNDGQEQVGILSEDGKSVIPANKYADMPDLMAHSDFEELLAISRMGVAAVPIERVKILAPITEPANDIICLGINYASHDEELPQEYTEEKIQKRDVPVYFSKRVTRCVDPDGAIDGHFDIVSKLDYECELAVIIGKDCKDVSEKEAPDYIFGYTILNDVTARDVQTAHKQWYFGKSLDGFTPIGPCIVTADEFEAYPPQLGIRSFVNGEKRQDSNTRLQIFDIDHVIHELSQGMTLKAGTIIATGTPAGVGMGMDPPQFLQPGDTVRCEIDGIGSLTNTVR